MGFCEDCSKCGRVYDTKYFPQFCPFCYAKDFTDENGRHIFVEVLPADPNRKAQIEAWAANETKEIAVEPYATSSYQVGFRKGVILGASIADANPASSGSDVEFQRRFESLEQLNGQMLASCRAKDAEIARLTREVERLIVERKESTQMLADDLTKRMALKDELAAEKEKAGKLRDAINGINREMTDCGRCMVIFDIAKDT